MRPTSPEPCHAKESLKSYAALASRYLCGTLIRMYKPSCPGPWTSNWTQLTDFHCKVFKGGVIYNRGKPEKHKKVAENLKKETNSAVNRKGEMVNP